jgi:hypothetical protein
VLPIKLATGSGAALSICGMSERRVVLRAGTGWCCVEVAPAGRDVHHAAK